MVVQTISFKIKKEVYFLAIVQLQDLILENTESAKPGVYRNVLELLFYGFKHIEQTYFPHQSKLTDAAVRNFHFLPRSGL